MKQKLPVFFHVPKNAGTYVTDWLLVGFRQYRRTKTNWLQNYTPEKDSIKTIQILREDFIVARCLVGDPNYILDAANSLTKLDKNNFKIDIKEIYQLNEFFVFAVIVEARGFKIKDQILENFKQYDLKQFLILRDCFGRNQSEFHYIQSQASKHELSHKAFGDMCFEEYILSDYFPDSWLIRNLLDVKDTEPITQKLFDQACSLLKETFKVYDIKQTDKAISDILIECYQIDPKDIQLKNWDCIAKNENQYKKIKLEDLPLSTQKTFNEKTYWDQNLYNILCQNQKHQ